MEHKPFMTVAGRWQEHRAALLAQAPDMDNRTMTVAMLMFFSGFDAGMGACIEVSGYSEDVGIRLMELMQHELDTIKAQFQKASAPTMN